MKKKPNIFDYLKNNDILLHHPYNDFKQVIDFLEGPGIRNWQYTDDDNGIKFINIRCIQNGDLTCASQPGKTPLCRDVILEGLIWSQTEPTNRAARQSTQRAVASGP